MQRFVNHEPQHCVLMSLHNLSQHPAGAADALQLTGLRIPSWTRIPEGVLLRWDVSLASASKRPVNRQE